MMGKNADEGLGCFWMLLGITLLICAIQLTDIVKIIVK